ncbi:MAG: ferrous iron transport protein B [Deltaproteobacteria bacterium]|nr:ferrous iron transport protein B [Deltaproteobacteria bacterium]
MKSGDNGGERLPVIALAGQPNCGKSTLFNALAGFKADTGNFPGTTVSYTASEVVADGRHARIIDLPGTYSISPHDAAELVTRNYLLSGKADVLVAVVDASVLARSIELTLQLLEMGVPMVLALNMVDEAERKGIVVDVDALQERLGIPVVPTVAIRGKGVVRVVSRALAMVDEPSHGKVPIYDRDVEETVKGLLDRMPAGLSDAVGAPARFVALRLLEGDHVIEDQARRVDSDFLDFALAERKRLAQLHDWPEETTLSSHRHAVAMDLFEEVARVVPRKRRSFRDRLDSVVMHPVLGLVVAAAAFASLFLAAFLVGDWLAGMIGGPFERLSQVMAHLAADSILWAVARGFVEGVAGGAGIVLPYLLPLLLMMSIYEDVGYLPRAAYMVDGLLHRIGLHGKSIIPLILGYGCNVPAIMGTRILETPRDRVLTSLLVPFIPCSARTVVILALVAALLGPWYALGVYVLNILVTALVGRALSSVVKGTQAGLLMDVPPYRTPPVRSVLKKVWFRTYEFLVAAWPILIVASVVMGVLEYVGINDWVNAFLSPLTVGVLGLPQAVGVTLFFGLLRKELSLILLFQALGTTDVASVMTPAQILGFTLFVTFYIPCVATIATMVREVGWRWAGVSAALNTAVAIVAATLVRFLW